MNISTDWDNPEKTAIRWQFEPGWTWDDMYRTRAVTQQRVQSVPYVVDIILDMERSPKLPKNALTHLNIVLANRSPNAGRFIFVKPSLLIASILKLFQRLKPSLGERVLAVDSVEAARELVTARENA